MNEDGAAIRAIELRKVYGTKDARVEALKGVSIEVADGERVALLGKSGSGKSTLLNLLGGLDRPTSGQVIINGRDLAQLSGDERARHRRDSVGLVFQSYHLIPSRTAAQNVELPLLFTGTPPADSSEPGTRSCAPPTCSEWPSPLSGSRRPAPR